MKNNNTIKKLLYGVLSLLIAMSSVFFFSCNNYDSCYKSYGKFFIEHAEWVSDELSFESRGFRLMLGKMKINGEEIEVIIYIFNPSRGGSIFKKSDFSDDIIEAIKNSATNEDQEETVKLFRSYVKSYDNDNGIESIYTFRYSDKWTEPVRVEITFDRYSVNDAEGIPDKSGETIVLMRQDVTPA